MRKFFYIKLRSTAGVLEKVKIEIKSKMRYLSFTNGYMDPLIQYKNVYVFLFDKFLFLFFFSRILTGKINIKRHIEKYVYTDCTTG